ncbi:error-prone DNA polymerase, DnaE-like [Faunimonas pinastri]|uniref:Error-prone DNA polymerase n=1 Tax=Faunimonas pinastri TaxID=1855383 RepID=A0A1H9JWZ0_9HYPH|nr:error-prone DNA polymerase [Faunimonas pinastri]SEQ91446.1 error-prone DNA polymerase, DnaE-like [Faunimonas pinastri]
MPEQPPSNRPAASKLGLTLAQSIGSEIERRQRRAGEPAYAELLSASNFSFLHGASHPEELAAAAETLELSGLVIADRNTLAGSVRGHLASRQTGTPYAVGSRLVFRDGTPDIVAWVPDRASYGRLCRLLSAGNLRAEKGSCHLDLADLLEWGEGLLLGVLPGQAVDTRLAQTLGALRDAFPRRVWQGATMLYDGRDARRLAELDALGRRTATPLVALGDTLHHGPERRRLQDVLTAIRSHVTIEEAGRRLQINGERHLKSAAEMTRLFRAIPQAMTETLRVFDQLSFSLAELKYEYPEETAGESATPFDELVRLTKLGAAQRYPAGVPDKVRATIRHELKLVRELKYEGYFLTVWDIVRFARSQGILCQGRGSAANSAVCYCLGVTEVDPDRADLLFERFISPERGEPPDIDVDFEHQRREEVIQYIYGKYGRDRAALAATVITYRTRSAAREVGKAFGLSEDSVGALAGNVWGWSSDGLALEDARRAGLDPADARIGQVMELTREIVGFPRHLSQHVGGFVITRGRVDETVPVLHSAMDGRTIIEWDKDDLDALGILKIDVLALGMLSAMKHALKLLETHYGKQLTLASIPAEDPEVYDMICRADTLGVFQIESRAQMTMLPRLRPRTFYDLVIEVAIVRPGPIQGDMVHPYLRRRQGLEKANYPRPAPEHDPMELEQVLSKTLGVPLFQEQAMRIAIVAAKFEPWEADKLRRAMATFRRVGTISTFQEKMVEGMASRGYDRAFAESCFRQIEGFGEYGFPESHAASFALLVYTSAWMKCHYPDVFCAAMLNAQPMGFYAPAQLVRDAREHGVEVRPVDINHSDWLSSLEPEAGGAATLRHRVEAQHATQRAAIHSTGSVRLGFRQIRGLREDEAERLVSARGGGYRSVRELWLRTGLMRASLERLAEADAFRSVGLDRRAALWEVRALDTKSAAERLPLFEAVAMPGLAEDAAPDYDAPPLQAEPTVALPAMPLGEHVVNDYRSLSLSLKAHPVSFLRDRLRRADIVECGRLREIRGGRHLTVAGLVLVRQRPGTAKGVIFATLEDETGVANVIVWPKVFEKYRAVVMGARFIAVTGRLQSEQGVIHLVADQVEDLSSLLSHLSDEPIGAAGMARADEVRRPVPSRYQKVSTRSRLQQLLAEEPGARAELDALARQAGSVMPKGRNFQ